MNAYWKNRLMRGGILLPGLSEINNDGAQETDALAQTCTPPLSTGGKNSQGSMPALAAYREPLWIN